jgi:uncharacterized membrane protein
MSDHTEKVFIRWCYGLAWIVFGIPGLIVLLWLLWILVSVLLGWAEVPCPQNLC